MKKYMTIPLFAAGSGLLGSWLRVRQNLTGFEAVTGLPVPGNTYGLLLIALLFAASALILLLSRPLRTGGKEDAPDFLKAFASHTVPTLCILVAGVFLVILSGLAEIAAAAGMAQSVSLGSVTLAPAHMSGSASRKLHLILGAATAAAGGCLLSVVPACRRSGSHEANAVTRRASENLLLVPAALMVLRLVAVYREVSVNPSLMTYYPQILALTLLTLAFFRLSSFAFGVGNTRRFVCFAGPAVVLSVTVLADQTCLCGLLLYAGCALTLTAFLLLRLETASSR